MATSEMAATRRAPEISVSLEPALGHIRGKVVDGEGHALAGCTLSVLQSGRTALTDTNGNFIIVNIAPDRYTTEAYKEGYSLYASEVAIQAGDNPGFQFVLHASSPS